MCHKQITLPLQSYCKTGREGKRGGGESDLPAGFFFLHRWTGNTFLLKGGPMLCFNIPIMNSDCIPMNSVPLPSYILCFTSYFVFSIAVLPHSPGVVYYHLLLRRETRIPGVAPFSFRIGIWDLFVHRGQKSYTPTAFEKLWTTPGVRCMKHASS